MGTESPESVNSRMIDVGRPEEIDLAAGMRKLMAHWKIVAVALVAGGALGVLASYAIPPKYTARVTMVPQLAGAQAGILGRIANLTNMNLDAEGPNEAVYGEIVRSNSVLNKAIERKWASRQGAGDVSLYEVFGIKVKSASEADKLGAAESLRKVLREKCLGFRRDPVTGFMKIQATVPRDPLVAAELANFVVDELDEFNRTVRAAKATEHRKFVAASLDEVSRRLSEAESSLTSFEIENAMYASSPRLRQQHEALSREAQAQRSIWLQLRTELESAIVDEHKMMTSVGVLDRAVAPTRKSSPVRSIWAIAGAIISTVAVVAMKVANPRRMSGLGAK